MKKIFLFILTLVIITACNQNIDNDNAQQEELDSPILSEAEKKPTNFSDVGFELMETESLGNLRLGLTPEEIEKTAGRAEKITAFEIWEADGYQHQSRIYQKGTIEIDFVKLEDGKIISNMIEIKNGCDYKTSRNIGIGSTYDETFKAYKNEISTPESKEALIAGTIYGGLIFEMENNKVKTIFIGAAAE